MVHTVREEHVIAPAREFQDHRSLAALADVDRVVARRAGGGGNAGMAQIVSYRALFARICRELLQFLILYYTVR
jgi:hypothetical protein